MRANEKAVAAVLQKYQDALNASDTEAVMTLYIYASLQPIRDRRGGCAQGL
jgi:ketosteroid isomerase-like protein